MDRKKLWTNTSSYEIIFSNSFEFFFYFRLLFYILVICALILGRTYSPCRPAVRRRATPAPPDGPDGYGTRVPDGTTWVFDDAVGELIGTAGRRASGETAAAGPAGDPDAAAGGAEIADDAQLLSAVKKDFLVKLCASNGLPKSGTKAVLLGRLREFAAQR